MISFFRAGALLGAGILLAGCATSPSLKGGPAPSSPVKPVSNTIKTAERHMLELARQYPSPDFVKAWSCRSEHAAIRDLLMQLSVSINVSSEFLSTRKNLDVTRRSKTRMSLDSMESLKGLILKKDGECTFVAINPKNARDYYDESAKNREAEVSSLFHTLDRSPTSLSRFRAARRLRKLLQKLREDHDALALLGTRPKRLTISEIHMRRIKEALSFEVKAEEGTGFDTPMAVQGLHEDPSEEELMADFLAQKGYSVVGPLESPAFLVRVVIKKAVLPAHVTDTSMHVDFLIEASIVDRRSGKILRKRKVENVVGVPNFGPVNAPYADSSVTEALLGDLLASLSDSASDSVTDSARF
ncbi:hypothetical protein LptCag_1031 [Leptospirillum ferriphilum]|jgi:hypothetical protein|uniref:Lipoprotein n=2 Tax=Leptospirillum TaxID=179 RepID=A0A094W9Q7_9BACT|nr:hypothetical protein [Leptospirillum ferriphilum]EDZ38425.1 MAG: Protein of unknown function [Leptospirillum sp. Group II '5-way CG']KGA94268.1 hypothetical protein LptCag_1031 [Leptospirillum ferriphilum]